jgi:uncharacterized protein YhjY with autotransporter beta-barrel domain
MFDAKKALNHAVLHLQAADSLLHNIGFRLDLEYGNPDAQLTIDLNYVQRQLNDTISEAQRILSKNKRKLKLRY